MGSIKAWFNALGETQKKVVIVLALVAGLMILFPPKAVVLQNPATGGREVQSVSYTFLLNDPAVAQKEALRSSVFGGEQAASLVSSEIEWERLLLQLVVVGIVGFVLLRTPFGQSFLPARAAEGGRTSPAPDGGGERS